MFGGGDGVANLCLRDALDRGCDIADFSRGKFVHGHRRGREHADFGDFKLMSRRHRANAHALFYRAIKHTHIGERAFVVVIEAIEHQRGKRSFRIANRRRNRTHHSRENLVDV